jgi:hypothetical protein
MAQIIVTTEDLASTSPDKKVKLLKFAGQLDESNVDEKAKEIYEPHKEKLESSHAGKYIVIEVNSGKYFVETTKDEAMAQARKEFPKILLFVRRIGELEKVSHHSSSFSPKTYASVL